MGELLPCPFCGEAARFTEQCRDRRWGDAVTCDNCGASGGGYYNAASPETADKLALAAWNRRALPAAPAEDVRAGALISDIARGPMQGELMVPWINRMMNRAAAILRALEGEP